jgi:hypothetical protein
MELLIPGLILVGLMVYVSTRIKRSAAAAYEPEEIETDEFSVAKPEGFLHPLNNDNGMPFEAFTKEFGEDEARRIRHAWAELEVHEAPDPDSIIEEIRRSAGKVLNEETIKEGDRHVYLIDAERLEKEVPVTTLYKITADGSRVYEMRISVLDEQKDAYLRKIEEMRDSFRLK